MNRILTDFNSIYLENSKLANLLSPTFINRKGLMLKSTWITAISGSNDFNL
jgi:hypothetical protein